MGWRSILLLAERLAPWFNREGFADLDLGLRTICTRAWVIEVLDQVRATPIPLAKVAQRPDADVGEQPDSLGLRWKAARFAGTFGTVGEV